MKKKKIIRFSIVLVIFVIIFVIVYLISGKNLNNFNDYQEKEAEIIPYDMQKVNEYSYFFSIVNILNKYLSLINDRNNDALYEILHPEYLDLYQIDDQNLYDNLGSYSSLELSFKAKVMAYKTYNNKYLYYVKGDIIENNFEDSKIVTNDVMFLVSVDYDNITYAIYPLNYLYEVLPINNPGKSILLNSNNELIGSNLVTKEYICNLYLNDFIETVNNDLEKSYDLLSSDFRNKYYAKKNNYIDYMNNNKNKLNTQVYSCSSLSGKNHIYEIKDMNFNVYTFTEESIMNYKVEFTLN